MKEKLIDKMKNTLTEVRIFLSSTFMDLEKERQELMDKVFSILESRLIKKGITLTVVDLRWGITDEQSKVGEAVPLCLEEVDKCYPIFIGILGGRYGWIPSINDIKTDSGFYEPYKDVIDNYVKQRKSITEMEILYGVLERFKYNSKQQEIESRFYFGNEKLEKYQDQYDYYKNILDDNEKPLTEKIKIKLLKEAKHKQKKLKKHIKKEGYLFKIFDDEHDLAHMVMEDLENVLKPLLVKDDLTLEEREQQEHRSFEQAKMKGYVKRKEERELDNYYNSIFDTTILTRKPLFIKGESGIGKSTLVANWVNTLDTLGDKKLGIIKCYIGHQSKLDSEKQILRKISESICLPEETLPSEKEELYTYLNNRLYTIEKPTLIIIDGINQLPYEEGALTWLPDALYNHLGIIITCTNDYYEKRHLCDTYDYKIDVGELDQEEKKQLIKNYLRLHRKNIEENYIKLIIDRQDSLGNNPIYITTLLQEMVAVGKREDKNHSRSLSKLIDYYNHSKDMEELFQRLFKRYEEDYPKELIEQICTYILYSKNGLYHRELIELLQNDNTRKSYNAIDIYSVIAILENKFIKRNGQLVICHDYIKKVIQTNYGHLEIECRKKLRDYFKNKVTLNQNQLKKEEVEELLYQLDALGQFKDFFDVLCNPKCFQVYARGQEEEISSYIRNQQDRTLVFMELMKAIIEDKESIEDNWFPLSQLLNKNEEYELNITLLEYRTKNLIDIYSEEALIVLITWQNLAGAYREKGEYDEAIKLYKKVVKKEIEKYSEESPIVWTTWNNLAIAYSGKGEYDEAIRLYKKVAIKMTNKYSETFPEVWITWKNLAGSYSKKGEYDEAIKLYKKVVKKEIEKYSEEYPKVWTTWSNLAVAYQGKGEYDEAIKLYKKVAVKRIEKYSEEYPKVWTTWNNIAGAYSLKGEYDDAIKLYKKVANKLINKYNEESLKVWTTWNNLALAYEGKREYDEAIKLYKKVVKKEIEKYSEESPIVWTIWNNMAGAFSDKGEYDEAIKLYKKVAKKEIEKYGEESPIVWTTWNNLAVAYDVKGEYDEAIKLYKKVAKKVIEKYSEESPIVWTIWNNLAGVYDVKGEYDEAIKLYIKVVKKRIEKYSEESPEVWTTWNNLALAYSGKGEYDEAIKLHKKVAKKKIEKYSEESPIVWTTWNNLAGAYERKGEYDEAIKLYIKVAKKRIEKYSEESPIVWDTWNNLGVAYSRKGEYDEAIKLYKKVAEKRIGKYSEETPTVWITWSNLAVAYEGKGEYDEAIKLYKKVAKKEIDKYSEESPIVWNTWNNLAGAYCRKEEYDEAISLYNKVIKNMIDKYSENSRKVWNVWSNLVVAYRGKGEYKKAIELYKKVAIKLKEQYGEEDLDLWTTWNNLGEFYKGKVEYEKAIELRKEAASKSIYVDKHEESYYQASDFVQDVNKKASFIVSSPSVVEKGMSFIIDVWAFSEFDREKVISRINEEYEVPKIKSKGSFSIPANTMLSIKLIMDFGKIDEPEDHILWTGEISNASFIVTVPENISKKELNGKVIVYLNGLEITKLYLIIKIGKYTICSKSVNFKEVKHKKAFVSYASNDRHEVLSRIQGIQKIAPDMDFFLDVISLRSGQIWEKELWQIIPQNDIFYLFWSRAASCSEWVEKEWKCALNTKGIDFIDPIPLDPPDIVTPPHELATKHFNDWTLAYNRKVKYEDNVDKQIQLTSTKNNKEIVKVNLPNYTIGRKNTDFIILSSLISRLHARIEKDKNLFYVIDLNSKNGTFINNERLQSQIRYHLKNGDILKFSNHEFIVTV